MSISMVHSDDPAVSVLRGEEDILDFSLPELRLGCHKKAYSSTTVSWLDSLIGHVEFEAWNDFDDVVQGTLQSVNRLSPRKLSDARVFFECARRMVKPTSSVGDESESADERETGTTNNTMSDEYEGVRGFTAQDERPTFLNERSLVAVYGTIFNGAQEVVQKLLKDRRYALKTNSVSLGIPTDTQEARLEALRRRRKFRKKSVRKKAGSASAHSEQSPTIRKRSSESQSNSGSERIPDYTLLVLKDLEQVRGRPICSFETKGLLVSISANGCESDFNLPESASIIAKRYNNLFRGAREPPANDKDDEIRENCKGDGSDGDSDSDIESISAAARNPVAQALTYCLSVASGCCYLFNYDVGIALHVIAINEETKKIHVGVSRAFHRGSDSTGGAVGSIIALCLHSIKRLDGDESLPKRLEEIADRVSGEWKDSEGTQNSTEPSVQAQISRNTESGYPLAKRARTGGCNDDLASPKTAFSKALLVSPEECGSHSSTDATYSLESNDYPRHRGYEHHDDDVHLDGEESLNFRKLELLANGYSGEVWLGMRKGSKVTVKVWNKASRDGLAQLCQEVEIYKKIKEEYPVLFESAVPRLISAWTDLDTEDSSGRVSKYPNSVLRNDFYSSDEPVLIIQYVGKELYRDKNGVLFCGERDDFLQMDVSDEKLIFKAARESLDALHSKGFIHGDIALRNLRVEFNPFQPELKFDSEVSNSTMQTRKCRAWWIDLGQARIMPDKSPRFYVERRDCRSLFHLKG